MNDDLDLDPDAMDSAIKAVIAGRFHARPAFDLAVDACRGVLATEAIQRLHSLDIEQDVTRLERWLRGLYHGEPPDPSIIALLLGIVGVDYVEGDVQSDFFLCGSAEFDPDDEGCEWACKASYSPEERYAGSAVVPVIDEVCTGERPVASLAIHVAYGAGVVNELCQRVGPAILLGPPERGVGGRAIAVGHTEGDAWLLGVLTRNGWVGESEFSFESNIGEA